jgi:hypothetical protein
MATLTIDNRNCSDPCVASLYNNLLAYYKFNDSTDTLVDAVAANNYTNDGGALEQSGKIDKSIYLNGAELDKITGSASYHGITSGKVTIAMWVKPGSDVTTVQRIYNDNQIAGTNYVGFLIRVNAGELQCGWANFSGSGVDGTIVAVANTWKLVAIEIDLDTNKYKTWENGNASVAGENIPYDVDEFIANDSHIGVFTNGTLQPFTGNVEDLKMWNRGLTQCEHEANWNSGNGIVL